MSEKPIKLNVLLAKTDHLAITFKNSVKEFIVFFKNSQGAFKGEKKTYTAKEGTIDLPKERSNRLVVTTVKEKLQWLESDSAEYIDALFSQEKTNSSGIARAKLKVDEKDFGEFTSLELLRLKSLLETADFKTMYETLPVRNDDELWQLSNNEMYKNKDIFESILSTGVHKTTVKEAYIIPDPNIDKVKGGNYIPQVASKDTIFELGNYTYQRFSGEYSHRQRAEILQRRSKLLTAVIEALKTANETIAEKSEMTAEKLFNYLHYNK